MEKKSLYIENVTIYTPTGKKKGSLFVKDGKIVNIAPVEAEITVPDDATIIHGEGLNVIPGFIDGHIHGAAGADTMDATEEALDQMAQQLPKEGTTSFLATTITQSVKNIDRALENIASYENKPKQAEMIGVHLEGPFIEASKKGAQPEEYIKRPDLKQFNDWQKRSNHQIRTITMAPEHDHDGSFIRALQEAGINVSAGHTDANFSEIKTAVETGLGQLTHLCNAMNGIHHRDIGAVGAAFQLEDLRAELIADGIHVNKDMVQIIYDNIGSDRLILITDAMRAKGLEPGEYELGGQPVFVTEDRAQLESGSLAGSILEMDKGARFMLSLENVSIEDVIQMASENPAKQIGIYDRKGSIEQNKDADLLIVDDQLHIKYTICRGEIAYKEEKE